VFGVFFQSVSGARLEYSISVEVSPFVIIPWASASLLVPQSWTP
jgi:hypothetical protein